MRSFLFLVVAALVALVSANELKIDTTFLPSVCERKVANGDNLAMHYTGSIDDSSATGVKGKVFDSSRNRGQPFDFVIGRGQVIQGWEKGLLGMCVGEKRTLTIPPEMGYGERGAGNDIPGGATLKFDVECVGIDDAGKQPPTPNIFKQLDGDGDKKITKAEMEAWFKSVRNMDLPASLFEQEDKDGDGFISYQEFSGPKGSGEDDEL